MRLLLCSWVLRCWRVGAFSWRLGSALSGVGLLVRSPGACRVVRGPGSAASLFPLCWLLGVVLRGFGSVVAAGSRRLLWRLSVCG